MLTKDNFRTYVGYQDIKVGPANGYLLSYTPFVPECWTKDIRKMTNDEVLDRIMNNYSLPPLKTLEIMSYPIECTMTLDRALDKVSSMLKSFPKHVSTLSPPFYLNSAMSWIARKSFRGCGNVLIENVLLYKGTTELDCCLAIIHCTGKYGIVKQHNFNDYGLVLDGTKI